MDSQISVRITGLGTYLPPNIIKDDFFQQAKSGIDHIDEQLSEIFQGGIERRFASDGETSVEFGIKASMEAIKNARVSPADIDVILVSSAVHDKVWPGDATAIQHGVGAENASAVNIDTACASFITSMIHGTAMIKAGFYKTVMIVAIANWATRIIDLSTKSGKIIGDGAGAVILSKVDKECSYISSWEKSYGQYYNSMGIELSIPSHIKKRNYWEQSFEKLYFKFNEDDIDDLKTRVPEMVPHAVQKAVEKTQLEIADINWFFVHQPGLFLIEKWCQNLSLPVSRCFHTFLKYGNLGVASIPVCLGEAYKKGILKRGDIIAMAAPGVGQIISSIIWRW
ncbi:MAG: ketoacyl-ACP synthase III [Nitrospirota bacterium]